jgi:hypothetical protein
MLTEDYIMRMISQALAVLMTALGLKKAGRYSEALQSFNQALETLLGLNANLVKQLDDSQILEMLTFLGKLDVDRLLVLADIYRESAEVYTMQGQPDNSEVSAQRSLRFYLEVALAGKTHPNIEVIQKIEAQRLQLNAHTLPVETRLALLDYLDRLLASDDVFLDSAGLSRPDLLAAFSSLDGPDIQ